MLMKEALDSLKLKFSSGNDVEVERATITREEYEAILQFVFEGMASKKELHHHHDPDVSNVGC
jgi:hypothetical protein